MRIRIETASEGSSCDVVIEAGAVGELGALLSVAAPAHRYVMITDSNVERHWGAAAVGALRAASLEAELIAFPAGEANKTRDTWSALTDRLLALGVGRDTVIVALGGGVVGDVAGFVAATYMRGLRCVQVPTSLLAMIDASVGGKTGVDTAVGKNLIGAFHQPAMVVVDPMTLRTLPHNELVSGLAEAIKHGAIADRGYFDWLADRVGSLRADDTDTFTRLIADSVRIKKEFVAADPFEAGQRAVLNFGHTVGHTLELSSNYALPHGHAVAIGMVAEARLGEALGITAGGTAVELKEIVRAAGLPGTQKERLDPRFSILTSLDKKARGGKARYVLLAKIGSVARGEEGEWTFAVDSSVVSTVLGDHREH